MTILGVLQNQWFENADRANEIIVRRLREYDWRALWVRKMLFHERGWTGARLRAVFGDWCECIVWENANPRAGATRDSSLVPDVLHLMGVLDHHQPELVLAFGRSAEAGLWKAFSETLPSDPLRVWRMVAGPHPSARGEDVTRRLVDMRREIERTCNRTSGTTAAPSRS